MRRGDMDAATARPKMREAVLFVLVAGLAFSTSSPLARYGRALHPLVLACGRVAVAGVVLLAVDPRASVRSVRGLTLRTGAAVLLAGALLAAHFALFFLGLDGTSLPAAVSLVSLEPLGVVLTAWALFGLRPRAQEQVGVVLATAGAVVVAQGAGVGEHRLAGDLLVLGAVALYGLYLAVARGLKDALPPRTYAALVYTSAAVVLAGVLAFLPAARATAWPAPARGVAAVLGLAFVPTLLGHTAVQTASRTLPPSVVALVSPGETLGGIALGAALLGAVPTAVELVGALVILAGTVVALALPAGSSGDLSRSRSRSAKTG
jgi:drug/metabolite transporter (DMT)-like permease